MQYPILLAVAWNSTCYWLKLQLGFFFHFKKKPTYDGFVIGLKRGDGLSDATGSVGDRSWVDTRRIRRRANVLQLGSHSRAVDKAGESVDVQHYGHRVHQLGERQLLTPTRGLIPACQSVDVVLTWGTNSHTHTHTHIILHTKVWFYFLFYSLTAVIFQGECARLWLSCFNWSQRGGAWPRPSNHVQSPPAWRK